MHQKNSYEGQTLIPQPKLCEMLGITRSGLEKLRKNDASFPKPLKFGQSRQAACYYVADEINAWLLKKIEERDAV